jgi:hypothetical protein
MLLGIWTTLGDCVLDFSDRLYDGESIVCDGSLVMSSPKNLSRLFGDSPLSGKLSAGLVRDGEFKKILILHI